MNARVLMLPALAPLGGCVTAGNFSGTWVNEKASPPPNYQVFYRVKDRPCE